MDNSAGTAALVIEHAVRKNQERRYEEWLGEILNAVSRSPGYFGREVFPPVAEGKPYTTIVRFASEPDVQTWLDSPERKAFIEKMSDALAGGDHHEIRAGIDYWFPAQAGWKKPQAYKEFLLTLATIYPLTTVIPLLLAPVFQAAPPLNHPLVKPLIIGSIVVGLMVYLIMPRVTRWAHNWLYDKAKNAPGAASEKRER